MNTIKNQFRLIAGIFLCTVFIINVSCSKDDGTSESELPTAIDPPSPEPTEESEVKTGSRTIISEDQERHYILRVPKSYTKEKKMPLVLVLHGYSSTNDAIEKYTGFSALGEKEGFISIYPLGTRDDRNNSFWTIGGTIEWNGKRYNDQVLITDIIESAKEELSIDEKRIYLVGNSNGGFMTHRFGAEQTDQVSAIAIMAGLMPKNVPAFAKGKLPVLHLHGLQDTIVSPRELPEESRVFSLGSTLGYWLRNSEIPAETKPDILRNDEDVTILEWKSSPALVGDLKYIRANKAGHMWFKENNVAKIDATREIWEFFKAHPKQ